MSLLQKMLRLKFSKTLDNSLRKIYYPLILRIYNWELREPDLSIVKLLVKPKDFVIDIGANIGVYTHYFAHLVGSKGAVLSIEPVQETYTLLRHNISFSMYKHITAVNCALSDSVTVSTIEIPMDRNGKLNFYRSRVANTSGMSSFAASKTQEIYTTTLDELCIYNPPASLIDRRGYCTLIKCDVEGHELACIKGSERTVQEYNPAWLVEVSGNPDEASSKAHCLIQQFYEWGYEPYWYNGKILQKRQKGQRTRNCWFLTDKHIRYLRQFSNILHY